VLKLSTAVGFSVLDAMAVDVVPDRFNPALESVDPEMFKNIFAALPAGVSIVTTRDSGGVPIGITVSAVMALSLAPSQLLISVNNRKYTMVAIEQSGCFAVNFLSDQQSTLSDRFARPAPDKFAGVAWEPGPALGLPVLSNTRAHAECQVERLIRCGDHTLVVGRVVSGTVQEGSALVYCDRRYAALSDSDHLDSGTDA
jgi:flavin reductase (DIM6/NTAB) family NADH-FMN oxidoreductase RutF